MNWRNAESTVRPSELDTKSSAVVNYIRKNIREEQIESYGQTVTMFRYEELEVLKTDWNLFSTVFEDNRRIADVEDAVIELAELIGG